MDALPNVTYNDHFNSIDVRFPQRPAGGTLSTLKSLGFNWSPGNQIWYASQAFHELRWDMRYNYSRVLLKEGAFNTLSAGGTVYVRVG